MNTTPQQLRLAADIIENGLSWQVKYPNSSVWANMVNSCPAFSVVNNGEIRLTPKQYHLTPPPPGKEWHRTGGWTEDMLPEGYRPLLKGEVYQKDAEDEILMGDYWQKLNHGGMPTDVASEGCFIRTTRPLPTEPEYINLGPEDVPPGSVFRCEEDCGWIAPTHVLINGIKHQDTGCGVTFTYYYSLNNARYKINRSIPITGKWDATAWEPCHKQK